MDARPRRCRRPADCRGGTLLVVQPAAGDELSDNLHPIGRLFDAGSVLLCTPLAQDGPVALGGQAGERRLREVLTQAGFTQA